VALEDGGFAPAECGGNAIGFLSFGDQATIRAEQGMVFVESAGVLSDGIQRAAEGGPYFAVERVGVGGANDIGAGCVNARVDGEGCPLTR
jgi:hypothetical protein